LRTFSGNAYGTTALLASFRVHTTPSFEAASTMTAALVNEEKKKDPSAALLRIACLLPAATDICIALGLADQIVGVTHECDRPTQTSQAAVALTRDGLNADESTTQGEIHEAVQQSMTTSNSSEKKNLYPIVNDAWDSARPNLVITQDLCAVCGPTSADVCLVSKASSSIDPTVISLSPHSLSDIVDCIRTVATACRVEESKTAAAVQDFTSRLERVQESAVAAATTSSAGGRGPTALVLEWLDPPFDGGHWIPEMLEIAGCTQALPQAPGSKSSVLTWEKV
jgi:iron complex transport system substrate-binding protein